MADKGHPSSSISRRRDLARHEPSAGYLERRDQLLRAAGEVFKRKGLQATSISDVAAELGTDRASVYYYYASKEEIFHDLVGEVILDVVSATEIIAGGGGIAPDKLTATMELVFTSFDTTYPYLYLYIQEDASRDPDGDPSADRLRALAERFQAAVRRIITDGLEAGELRADVDPELLTLAVLGAANWSHRWFRPGGRFSGAAIGRAMAEFFLQGITPEPAAAPSRRRRSRSR